jgi:hypothetical protein
MENVNVSLALTTLTVYVVHMAIFEYQNQVIFNRTVFDGGPRCHLLLVSTQKRRFWNTKSKSFPLESEY